MSIAPKIYYCNRCHKTRVREEGYICLGCQFDRQVEWTLEQDGDDQDWSFAICECCGTRLQRGVCMNTSCGCSPHVGEDWY